MLLFFLRSSKRPPPLLSLPSLSERASERRAAVGRSHGRQAVTATCCMCSLSTVLQLDSNRREKERERRGLPLPSFTLMLTHMRSLSRCVAVIQVIDLMRLPLQMPSVSLSCSVRWPAINRRSVGRERAGSPPLRSVRPSRDLKTQRTEDADACIVYFLTVRPPAPARPSCTPYLLPPDTSFTLVPVHDIHIVQASGERRKVERRRASKRSHFFQKTFQ